MLSPLAYVLLLLALLKCSTLLRVDATNITTAIADNATHITDSPTNISIASTTTSNTTTTTTTAASTPITVNPSLWPSSTPEPPQNDGPPISAPVHPNTSTDAPAEAAESLPIAQPLVAEPAEPPLMGSAGRMPEFPQRTDAVYFIVAVTGGAKIWGRTLARTLIDMGAPFGSPQGPPLRPLYVDVPPNGRFSVRVLTALCQQSEGQPLAGLVVIGDGHSARAVAMAGSSMGLPVLWAKGGTANLDGMHREIPTPLQVMLQPSAKEILESVRALFLQTHWHSFFVLSDVGASMVMAGVEGGPLTEPPLVPKILPLSANSNDVFRQLAQISRSTRGVVLLLCDLESARRIMAEAQNLNMVGGHFIWIWADTSSTTEFFEAYGGMSAKGDGRRGVDGFVDREIPTLLQQNIGHLAKTGNGRPSDQSMRGHLEGLLERKMEFEDRHPQRSGPQGVGGARRNKGPQSAERQRNAKSKEVPDRQRAQQPPDRYIIGLNSEAEDLSEEFGPQLKRHQDPLVPLRRSHEKRSSDESAEHFFISNLNSDDGIRFAGENIEEHMTGNAGNRPDDALDPDTIGDRKPKRKTQPFVREFSNTADRRSNYTADPSGDNQHVLFHHFKDFPVGFLALRPIRMNVDRHFIRAAVRLFASTWAKVELEAREHTMRSMHRAKSKLNQWGDQLRWKLGPQAAAKRRRKKREARRNDSGGGSVGASKTATGRRRNEQNQNTTRSGLSNEQQPNQQPPNAKPIGATIPKSNIVGDYNGDNNDNDDDEDEADEEEPDDADEAATLLARGKIGSAEDYADAVDTSTGREGGTHEKTSALNKRHNTWWSLEHGWPRPDTDIRYMRGAPHYQGGCYGRPPEEEDRLNANYFARMLKENCQLAMSGQRSNAGFAEKALTTHFELLNLVPDNTHRPSKSFYNQQQFDGVHTADSAGGGGGGGTANNEPDAQPTKWRRVGLVSGRNVHLDTIVWPGGDIVVSGLSARARSVFRVVTALAPPFVMESDLDEDGLCLRGLPCHRLATTGRHNLTLMFNAIETRDRLEEDAMEHGNEPPPERAHTDEKVAHIAKCCYGLSMDILDNVATELGFEFHLYIVRDELFGAKHQPSAPLPPSGMDRSQPGGGGGGGGGGGTGGGGGVGGGSRKNYDHKSQQQEQYQQYGQQQQQQQQQYQQKPPAKVSRDDARHQWNGIMGDLVNGLADMSFAPLSVSKSRAEVIDFTAPYFHSGVSLLAAPLPTSEIPLLAFLLPFSPELWIAIFTSLNITAVAVAVYEWLSPFGLNPWGRQRSKNFSMSSALWVMWGLLCGHLVAFKAPKSWPNKFLINVWGGFSVIFVASYTANIAALIAGLFFHNAANIHDTSLFRQRVGVPKASAAESYVMHKEPHLWEHMKKYRLEHIEDGIRRLKNGSLDLLMADAPVLDYYRATDHGCKLQRFGDLYVDDSYAIGMKKGFPLRDSISELIAKYASNGYLDILTEKWYGGLPCFKFEADIVQPRPLDFEAVAGVFLLLGMGMFLGLIILIFEHWFYKFALPRLRLQPKDTVWKSRNIMFFSQKLYRFINCVELVSPHHAARELVHSIRQGQIASLFQKSIKRKEDEQRRRRKSKAQFFEMIQEIRRVQQVERDTPKLAVVTEDFDSATESTCKSPPSAGGDGTLLGNHDGGASAACSGTNTLISTNSTSGKPRSSPRGTKLFAGLLRDTRSRSNSSALSIRRFSTDSIFGERMDTIGRRLSRDISYSPPDLGGRRFETFGKSCGAGAMTLLDVDTYSSGGSKSNENITSHASAAAAAAAASSSSGGASHKRYNDRRLLDGHHTLSGASVAALALPDLPATTKKYKNKRPALNFEPYQRQSDTVIDTGLQLLVPPTATGTSAGSSLSSAGSTDSKFELPTLKEGLEPPIYQVDRSKAVQRARMHRELRDKYAQAPLVVATAIDERPPVMPAAYRSNAERLARHQLLEAPLLQQKQQQQHQRPPVPSPRQSKRDVETGGGAAATTTSSSSTATTSSSGILKNSGGGNGPQPSHRSMANTSASDVPPPRPPKMSFDRLSREDLLRLSHSSQSEIHEYLNGSSPQARQPEPP